jgi:hypothetical protein
MEGLALAVTLLETLDSTGGVYELLLAREERVAGVADLQAQVLFGRVGLERIAAGADGRHQVQLGMYVLLHDVDLD